MKQLLPIIISLFFLTKAHAADTQGFSVKEVTGGETIFKAIGRPSALKINGEGPAPKGELSISPKGNVTGKFTFELDQLKTGIGLRDRHMKEKYLETKTFPTAELTITEMTAPPEIFKEKIDIKNMPFKANLKVHGVEKEFPGFVHFVRDGSKITANVRMDVQVTDFNIEEPGFAGITMADQVELHVKIEGKAEEFKESKAPQS